MGPSAWPSLGFSKFSNLLCGLAPLSAGETSVPPEGSGPSLHPSWLLGSNVTLLFTRALVRGGTWLSASSQAEQPAWPFWVLIVPHRTSTRISADVLGRSAASALLCHLLILGHPSPLGSHAGFLRGAPLSPFTLTQSESRWGTWGRDRGRCPSLQETRPSLPDSSSWKEHQEWVICSTPLILQLENLGQERGGDQPVTASQ